MEGKVLLIQGWTWALDMSKIIDFCCFMAPSEVFSGFPVPAHITSEKQSRFKTITNPVHSLVRKRTEKGQSP